MLNAICAAALIASKIPPIPPSASLYIAAFVGIITALGAVIVAVAGVIDLIPGVEEFLDGGIKILVKIGTGIGEFVGSLVGGVMDGIAVGATKDLPEVGKNIAEFLKAFSGMDNSVKTGIEVFADAAGAILSLSKSNILDGIANKLGFNTGLDNFGEQAKYFGKAMHALSDSLTGENVIDTEAVKGVAKVGQLLAALANDIPPQPGDILKKFVFSQNLGEFGKQVETFGKAMSAMSKAVSGENAIDTDAVKGVTKAGKMLSALADDIPPHPGDILEKFVFSKDLGNFGEQALAFGKAISAMSKAVSGDNTVDVDAIESAKNAGELLVALKNSMEGDPGVILSAFVTNKNLGNFGGQAKAFGEAISAMSKAITGENAIDVNAVTNAKNIGTMMTELQKALPKDEWFDGVMQLDDFGSDISAFGQGLLVYNANVADIDFTKVSASVSQAKRMVSLANSIYGNSSNVESGIKTFKDFEDISETIKNYSDDVSNTNMDSISDSISIGFRLKTFISSLKDINTTGITSFKDAVSKLGEVELGSIKNAGNIDLQNNVSYRVICSVAMDSGLSAERNEDFTVAWTEMTYSVNAEMAYSPETYDDGSILYPDISTNRDMYGIPNVVEVSYSGTNDNYYSRVVNDDPNSPVSTVNRGREITHRVTNPEFAGEPTEGQIEIYARNLLEQLSSIDYTVSFSHGYCPVRLGDCVRLNYSRAGINGVKAKITKQSITCKPGCKVTETAVFTKNLWR